MTKEAYVTAVAEGRAQLRDQQRLLAMRLKQDVDERGEEGGLGSTRQADEQEGGDTAATTATVSGTGEQASDSAAGGPDGVGREEEEEEEEGREATAAEAEASELQRRLVEEEEEEAAADAERTEGVAVEALVSELFVLFVEPGVGHVETAAMNRVVRQFMDRHLLQAAGLRPAVEEGEGGGDSSGGGGFSASIRRNTVAL